MLSRSSYWLPPLCSFWEQIFRIYFPRNLHPLDAIKNGPDEIMENFFACFSCRRNSWTWPPSWAKAPSPGKDRWVGGGRRQFDAVGAVKGRWPISWNRRRRRAERPLTEGRNPSAAVGAKHLRRDLLRPFSASPNQFQFQFQFRRPIGVAADLELLRRCRPTVRHLFQNGKIWISSWMNSPLRLLLPARRRLPE